MIKLFRRIRQNLLNEGNFKKYLLYAFGEIILVVVGILIALQINNWNTHRNGINNLIKSYEQLQQSLDVDLTNLSDIINVHIHASESADRAMNHLMRKQEWTTDLLSKILASDDLKFYAPQSSTFESIKLNGFELIDNPLLTNQLFRVYEEFTVKQWLGMADTFDEPFWQWICL